MNNTFLSRLRSAWNVFRDNNPVTDYSQNYGSAYARPNHKLRLQYGNEKSIVGAIYNRFSVDISTIKIQHVRVDENQNYLETIQSGLNRCLNLETNIDQSSRTFIQDVAMSMFDEGVVAIVPVDTSISLTNNNTFDILTMRTARIVQWHPQHVRLSIYNDGKGEREERTLPKSKVAILENPFYSVMNEKNSVGKRLIDKLNLLDAIDNQSGSGKLDLIIQLPYVVKSAARQAQAEQRRRDIETQLKDSKYGVAYADGTEKVIQLNRPAENQLMTQIEYLTRMLYSQLGISEKILDGTANEEEMLNYYNRIIEPVVSGITFELKRKFLTQTATTQGQSIMHFRNVFALITAASLAELSDKLTRNEIATSNDMRSVIGWTPSKAPGADELRNKNLNPSQIPLDATKEFASLNNKGE